MTLRLLLGDQLNVGHSWFRSVRNDVVYCLMEMRQETDYANHHLQKVLAFFKAMRAFAAQLRDAGHQVHYLPLDASDNRQTLPENLSMLIRQYDARRFEYLLPDEYRLDEQLEQFCQTLSTPSAVFDTEHFLCHRHALRDFFGEKNFLMESFYRHIRRKHGWLMEGDKPIGGKWNFDVKNRKALPRNHHPPFPLSFENDASDIFEMLRKSGVQTMGTAYPDALDWPIDRGQGLQLLRNFCENLLPHFGDFQDAMSQQHWLLYHSRLSFSMNLKMLSPVEIIESAIEAWRQRPSEISLNQVEGFVRQIAGWREYMRGIYWAKMPAFRKLNYFGHNRPLPSWFWTGQTQMNCLRQTIGQSLRRAYAHHIQRLMVTGNFALLAGIHPDEVDGWYLGIYADAIEWVELTNTRGMSQFADGGITGTKPYCSSANYINKMSDYCAGCRYDPREKIGPNACPFNSLYWHFHHRHRHLLEKNPRIGMVYRLWDKMNPAQKDEILSQAERLLDDLENL
ncbi:MAG: cryptochrome/photolyase family protein [Bacteroidetes bacterium]|nr:MAG: cryptochrome/photolyase family protein [Bacteroidota bacterium]